MFKPAALAFATTALVLTLTGCSNTGDAQMLQIYVSADTQQYVDLEPVTSNKDTVVIDDANHLRTFLYASSNCTPTIQRIVSDGKIANIYVPQYSGDCTVSPVVTSQNVLGLGSQDFTHLGGFNICTTDSDCKPIDNVKRSQ